MDLDNSGETSISLTIKTPNQAFQDQTIEGVDLDWTVKDLKTHLSAVYPSRPVRKPTTPCSGMLVAFPPETAVSHFILSQNIPVRVYDCLNGPME